MGDIAGWVALVATSIAALMTAANLGARVTGWGFAVFTIGALAWIVVGATTGQTQLLWSNVFLGAVDLFGVWRWLGRRARFADAAEAERTRSREAPGDDLFPISRIDGMAVKDAHGATLACAVDALAACGGGGISHVIIREGGVAGVGETLRKLPWREVSFRGGALVTRLNRAGIADLPVAEPA